MYSFTRRERSIPTQTWTKWFRMLHMIPEVFKAFFFYYQFIILKKLCPKTIVFLFSSSTKNLWMMGMIRRHSDSIRKRPRKLRVHAKSVLARIKIENTDWRVYLTKASSLQKHPLFKSFLLLPRTTSDQAKFIFVSFGANKRQCVEWPLAYHVLTDIRLFPFYS